MHCRGGTKNRTRVGGGVRYIEQFLIHQLLQLQANFRLMTKLFVKYSKLVFAKEGWGGIYLHVVHVAQRLPSVYMRLSVFELRLSQIWDSVRH